MKLGMTRWKMVPSKSGTPTFFWPVMRFVHCLVPSAKPTKLATVLGASRGKSLQVSLPMVVSKTTVGSPTGAVDSGAVVVGAAAFFFAVVFFLAVGVCVELVWACE